MACARTALTASFWLSTTACILVLCGLAAVQNLCHTDGPVVSNSRKLLQLDGLGDLLGGLNGADLTNALDSVINAANATCSTAFRFQWWGWALQVTFLVLQGFYWIKKINHAGVLTIGGTSTLLAMVFANDTLKANEALGDAAFSRNTLLFVGWILVATFNYFMFIAHGHCFCETAASCCAKTTTAAADTAADAAPAAATKPAATAGGDVEVAASTA